MHNQHPLFIAAINFSSNALVDINPYHILVGYFNLIMETINYPLVFVLISLLIGCQRKGNDMSGLTPEQNARESSTFQNDVDFLKRYTNTIVLQDSSGGSKVAVCGGLQGRVMTSTSEGNDGMSYGWINKKAFTSGDTSDHINVYGGEDRIWLGPEGGQFSIYFSKGKEFNLDNWYVPRVIDLEPYEMASSSRAQAVFVKQAELTNYAGTVFNIALQRTIKIIEKNEALKRLELDAAEGVSMVAFESINELKNNGKDTWQKETGLLSIWILGMFNPSPGAIVIIPYQGSNSRLREIVNDNYFGQVPEDRLKLIGKTVFFKADGQYRSKIGLLPENAPQLLGSYDSDNGVLTVVKYSKPANQKDYVNSLWEIQKEPYRGDAINAYNDGPPSPGAKPLGPFYELETSSPAAALQPEASITHIHATFHFKGMQSQLDPIIKKLFSISIEEAKQAF